MSTHPARSTNVTCATRSNLPGTMIALFAVIVSPLAANDLDAEGADSWYAAAPIVELEDAIDSLKDDSEAQPGPEAESEPQEKAAPVVRGKPVWAQPVRKIAPPNRSSQILGLAGRGAQRPNMAGRSADSEGIRSHVAPSRPSGASVSPPTNVPRNHYQGGRSGFDLRSSPTQLTRASKPSIFNPSLIHGSGGFLSLPVLTKTPASSATPTPAQPDDLEVSPIESDVAETGQAESLPDEKQPSVDPGETNYQESTAGTVAPVEIDLSADEDLSIGGDSSFVPSDRRYTANADGRLFRIGASANPSSPARRIPSEESMRLAGELASVLSNTSSAPAEPTLPTSFAQAQGLPPSANAAPPTMPPQQPRPLPVPPEAVAVPQDSAAPDSSPGADSPSAEEEFRPIRELQASISTADGERPSDVAQARFSREGYQPHVTGFSRFNFQTVMNWEASALCHRPLYFEEVNLERHGYQIPLLQPVVSGAHFFSRIPAVPYLVVSQHQRICNYTLGHYRPGSPAPYVWYYPNFSLDGAAVESILITGLMYAIP
jgi:hypothetical protein